ncbi:MAG: 2-C-methyl-D-erythritol 2,4-cyclodiphosphate synthase [Leptospiraceae bacterium]|nr:2-C-methyl-D-erythritol 2,4-cyclodiphosphate synthase [Leptospiraceae bacterium]MDW8305961.1 2-C-methyl-D-erythritol 2,4-cyclodiphosphate synthase [Leptospiraceae bacterium]
MSYRIGQGFDIHRSVPGDRIKLAGVEIPAPFSLDAHSDGDVVLHALTDAILGALGEKDIGFYFPPTPENKGRSSQDFVLFARRKVEERGYFIVNLDCNILCEEPKIQPWRDKLIESLSRLLEITTDRIAVKGRSLEGLGSLGQKKGIAAMVVVLLQEKQYD